MDPISALSVAGVAIQFVDFGSKLLPKILSVYRKLSNAEKGPFMDVRLVATRLTQLTSQIDNVLGSVKLQRPLTSTENAITEIARECGVLSADLLAALKKAAPRWFMDDLLHEGVESKASELSSWRKLRAAVRAVRSAEYIEELQRKLDNLRQQLMIEILATLYERFPSIYEIPQQHEARLEPGLAKEKVPTESGSTERCKLNLVDAINANTQRMLDSRRYDTRKLELGEWGCTPVGSSLMDRLMDHLYYPEIMDRENRIAQPYADTFQWIFTSSNSSNSEFVSNSFRNWLCKGSGTYWVTGKAGSGKSTLLKSIHNDPRTANYLENWSSPKPLIEAAFFFWNSGSELQMSQAGMIRSLLYQYLQQRRGPKFNLSLLASQWDTFILSRNLEKPWSWTDLVEAFQILIHECAKDEANYFFLIDGLDEFEGSKRDLLDLLNYFACLPNVKLCVSSRPWVVFEDAYKQKPSLTVQELTRGDIKHYVTTNLQNHPGFQELFEVNPKYCRRIINDVTTKASGVFLWVVLVVRSLLDGLTNGDRLKELQQRFDDIPEDLEDLFSKILNSMEPRYYTSSSELFQIFRAAKRCPTVICMSYAHEDNDDWALQQAVEPIQRSELRYRALTMKRRLDTRCKGLLEVGSPVRVTGLPSHSGRESGAHPSESLLDLDSSSSHALDLADSKVEYLHRTVKDWLYRPDIWAQITSATADSFNPEACLARAYLLQLKSLPLDNLNRPEYGFWDLLTWCTEYSSEVGKTDEFLEDQLLEEMNRVGITLSTATDYNGKSYVQRFWGTPGSAAFHWASTVSGSAHYHDFLDFAVRYQLYPYLKRKLSSANLGSDKVSALLRTSVSSYIFEPGLRDGPACTHIAPNYRIIKLLLEKGGVPDLNFHNSLTQFLETSNKDSRGEAEQISGLLKLHRVKKTKSQTNREHKLMVKHTNHSLRAVVQRTKSVAGNLPSFLK